jgi:hypothetical protein
VWSRIVNHDPRRYADVVVSLDAYREEPKWRARREAQIEASIRQARTRYDDAHKPRPRWLDHVGDAWLAAKFIGAILLLCVVILLSPLIACAAWLRAWKTP